MIKRISFGLCLNMIFIQLIIHNELDKNHIQPQTMGDPILIHPMRNPQIIVACQTTIYTIYIYWNLVIIMLIYMENVTKKNQFYGPVREPIHTICAYNPPIKFGHVWIYVENWKKKFESYNIWKMNHRNLRSKKTE